MSVLHSWSNSGRLSVFSVSLSGLSGSLRFVRRRHPTDWRNEWHRRYLLYRTWRWYFPVELSGRFDCRHDNLDDFYHVTWAWLQSVDIQPSETVCIRFADYNIRFFHDSQLWQSNQSGSYTLHQMHSSARQQNFNLIRLLGTRLWSTAFRCTYLWLGCLSHERLLFLDNARWSGGGISDGRVDVRRISNIDEELCQHSWHSSRGGYRTSLPTVSSEKGLHFQSMCQCWK